MKKTVASIIAGLTLVGAASAVPTPDDRKKLCESKPFDFVWVEKTKTCVPINPCATANRTVRDAYCIKASGYVNHTTAEEAINRYAKNVMKTGVSSVKILDSGQMIFALRTSDGGYYGVQFEGRDEDKEIWRQLEVACWAYGKSIHYLLEDAPKYACLGVNSQTECNNIADFASIIAGDLVEGEVEQLGQKVCWLINFDGWRQIRPSGNTDDSNYVPYPARVDAPDYPQPITTFPYPIK